MTEETQAVTEESTPKFLPVRFLHLSTGQVIIGIVVELNTSYAVLQSPLLMSFIGDDEGMLEGYKLMPYMGPLVEWDLNSTTMFMVSNIVSVNTPDQTTLENYSRFLQQFLPEGQKILLDGKDGASNETNEDAVSIFEKNFDSYPITSILKH